MPFFSDNKLFLVPLFHFVVKKTFSFNKTSDSFVLADFRATINSKYHNYFHNFV